MTQKKRELAHNELADIVGAKLDQIKPHMSKVAMGAIVLLLAIATIAYWISARQRAAAIPWETLLMHYDMAVMYGDNGGLKVVADEFDNTMPGVVARVIAADFDALSGARQWATNPEAARRQLQLARDGYLAVIDAQPRPAPLMLQRATLGLAGTYEMLADPENARQYYQRLVDELGSEPIGQLAREGLRRVSNPSIVAIYHAVETWQPSETAPGEVIPRRPDISFPDPSELTDPLDAFPRPLPIVPDGDDPPLVPPAGQPEGQPNGDQP